MKQINMKAGSVIFFENSTDQNVYIIKGGKVELTKIRGKYLVDNVLKKTKIMNPGDCFGFEELFNNKKRGERAIAKTDVKLIYFELPEFSKVLEKNIKIGEKILNSLASRIRYLNNRIRISCSEEKKITATEGSIFDIYIHYAKVGKLSTAMQVLDRMIKDQEYAEFGIREKDRLKLLMGPTITEEKIDEFKNLYKDDEKHILKEVMNGILERGLSSSINEKILYESMNLAEDNGGENYIKAASDYLNNFPNSKHAKQVKMKLGNAYCETNELVKALSLVNKLIEENLSDNEYAKADKLLKTVQAKMKEQ